MFAAGVRAMEQAFYRRLSITHWGRTTRERNLYNRYVKGRTHCLAFGPGGGGTLHGAFYMNTSDYRRWQERVRAGEKPLTMLLRPRPFQNLFKAVTEGMEVGWVDLPALEEEYGAPLRRIWEPVLAQWERAGLVRWQEGVPVLTLAGEFWQVNLTQLLLEYLKKALEE